jgi:HD superfamily phosphodiesterase
MMKNKISYTNLVKEHVEQLLSNLPPQLYYHNLQHTREVVEASLILAKGNHLSPTDTEIVTIAAWFHDVGHIQTYFDHEAVSAKLAKEFLHTINYPSSNIEKIISCILATTFPSQPKNLLEMVICDADMFHLAQDFYESRCFALKEELEFIVEKSIPLEEWCCCNKDFLEKHIYFTPFAKEQFNHKKNENIQKFLVNHLL